MIKFMKKNIQIKTESSNKTKQERAQKGQRIKHF